MKHAKKNNLLLFEVLTAYDKEVMSGYTNDGIIFYGWDLYRKFSKRMTPDIRKVYNNNGARTQISLHVTLFGLCVLTPMIKLYAPVL